MELSQMLLNFEELRSYGVKPNAFKLLGVKGGKELWS